MLVTKDIALISLSPLQIGDDAMGVKRESEKRE